MRGGVFKAHPRPPALMLTHPRIPAVKLMHAFASVCLSMVIGSIALAETASVAPPRGLRPVRVISNVSYLGTGRAEKLDLYLPSAGSTNSLRPAVVYFHGGGWVKGDKAAPREREIAGQFAAAGYVFVSANYALGERAWPRNLEDCKNAVRFLRSHAGQYRVDPERIAVMGASAGGHLALMVAYTAGRNEYSSSALYPNVSSRVSAVIDFYGITDLLTREGVREDGSPTGALVDHHAPEMLGVSRAGNPALWKAASPVAQITSSAPPTLIVHGLSDTIVDYGQAIELANALRAKGADHELVLLEGVGHMFDLKTWKRKSLPCDLSATVFSFLARHLKNDPPNLSS